MILKNGIFKTGWKKIKKIKLVRYVTSTLIIFSLFCVVIACSEPEPVDEPVLSPSESSNILITNVPDDYKERDEESYWIDMAIFWLLDDTDDKQEIKKITSALNDLSISADQANTIQERESIRDELELIGSKGLDIFNSRLDYIQNIDTPKQCERVSELSYELVKAEKSMFNQVLIIMLHERISLLNAIENNDEEAEYKYRFMFDSTKSKSIESGDSIDEIKDQLTPYFIAQDCAETERLTTKED